MRRLILVFLILFLLTPSFAQQGLFGAFASTGPLVGWSVRALGMGGAFSALEGDLEGALWNPASISRLLDSQLSIMYNYSPLTFEGFGFGTNMYITSYHILFGIPDRGLWSSGVFYTGLSPIEDLGILYRENQLGYTVAKSLDFLGIKNIALGFNFKRLWVNMPSPYKAEGWSIDLGIILRFSSTLKLGFSAQNLFASLDWYDGEKISKEPPPANFKMGICYQTERLTFAFDLDFPSLYYHIGGEYFFDPIFFRIGWNIDSPTLGLGFRSPDGRWRIDYALLYSLGIGGLNHRLGISMFF
ncbi:MAG: hypothetical protein ACPLKX_01845 [Dictyoglomaceae bacterium]